MDNSKMIQPRNIFESIEYGSIFVLLASYSNEELDGLRIQQMWEAYRKLYDV